MKNFRGEILKILDGHIDENYIEELCVCCYKHLLDNVYELERYESYQGLTIEEFLNLNPKGIFIIRVQGHLTCGIDGVLYDTWDCRNEIVDVVWKVK